MHESPNEQSIIMHRRNHVLKVGRDQRVGRVQVHFLPRNAWAIVALQGRREHAAKLPDTDIPPPQMLSLPIDGRHQCSELGCSWKR